MDNFGGGGEGVGRGDDFIACADADGFQCQVQACGGGIDGNGFAIAAYECGEVGFKAFGFWTGCYPAGAEGVYDFGDFGFVEVGEGEG